MPKYRVQRRSYSQKLRDWCFTLHVRSDEEEEKYGEILSNMAGIKDAPLRYIVFQLEEKEETKHFQGYAEAYAPLSRGSMKKLFDCNWIHLEGRQGSQKQAIEYCKKEETRINGPYEYGEPATCSQAKNAANAIIKGATIQQVIEADPSAYMRYHTGLEKLAFRYQEKRNWNMEIEVYYGNPGTGKTWTAHEKYPNNYVVEYDNGNGTQWWDGYEGEETIIMDEFRGFDIKFSFMLKLLDRYPLKVQVKGGYQQFRSKRIIITTNIHPRDWYPKVDNKSMLYRRLMKFGKLFEFKGPNYDSEGDLIREYSQIEWNLNSHISFNRNDNYF